MPVHQDLFAMMEQESLMSHVSQSILHPSPVPTAQIVLVVLVNALPSPDQAIVLEPPSTIHVPRKPSTMLNALPNKLVLFLLLLLIHAPKKIANLISRNINLADALSQTPSSENAHTINTAVDSPSGPSSSSLSLPSSLFWLSSSSSSS